MAMVSKLRGGVEVEGWRDIIVKRGGEGTVLCAITGCVDKVAVF